MTDVERPVFPLCQGQSNGCGTTALAMVLNSLRDNPVHALFSREQLDKGYREPDMFSAPGLLLKIAAHHGVQGEIEAEGRLDTIHSHLRQGHALLWLFSGSGRIRDLHYIVLSGWKEQPETGNISIGYWDPAIRQTEIQWIEAGRFQENLGRPLQIRGTPWRLPPFLLVFSIKPFQKSAPHQYSLLLTGAYLLNRLIYFSYQAIKTVHGEQFKTTDLKRLAP